MPRPAAADMLAVVDMGSNSFRLEVGRVEGDQIYRLDTWRETLRIGAGVDFKGRLTPEARRAALACLARFGERIKGLHPSAVRAVATNTFRVAANARTFLPQAERALGFPIDVITGHEEARLIYNGVAHVLPASTEPRLVIDIGGGSTEFIIGRGLVPERLESLKIGCVGLTQRYFPDGGLPATAFAAADTTARAEIEAIAREFARDQWREAYASSGTALALAEILEQNGLSAAGITRDGLARLRKRMVGAGHVSRLQLTALKPERAPVLAAGLAIMGAALSELDVERINPVGGALRLGVLYDLFGQLASRSSQSRSSRRPGRTRIAPRCSGCSGQHYCTKPGSRFRTPVFTSMGPTSCTTRTCRGFPRASSRTSRASFSVAAAASRKWSPCSATRRSARSSSRYGSQCCCTMRGARLTARAWC